MDSDNHLAPLTKLKLLPLVKYNGGGFVPWPSMEEDAGKYLDQIKQFNSRKSDVLLCTAPKAGTHWLHEIITMLLRQTTDYTDSTVFGVHLDRMTEFSSLEGLENPRLLHSHLPFSYLPNKHIEIGAKIVYVNRNPKDRHVSLYNFMLDKGGVPENWRWGDYFQEMVLHDNLYHGWFHYTKTFESAIKHKTANIFHVKFEDLLKNPTEQIEKLAAFLEVPYDETFIKTIVEKCAFDTLKKNKTIPGLKKGQVSSLFRKGVIGDWKSWFTVAQNEQFENIYKREMEGIRAFMDCIDTTRNIREDLRLAKDEIHDLNLAVANGFVKTQDEQIELNEATRELEKIRSENTHLKRQLEKSEVELSKLMKKQKATGKSTNEIRCLKANGNTKPRGNRGRKHQKPRNHSNNHHARTDTRQTDNKEYIGN